jgi:hypothetical protein
MSYSKFLIRTRKSLRINDRTFCGTTKSLSFQLGFARRKSAFPIDPQQCVDPLLFRVRLRGGNKIARESSAFKR